jgi:hypothetical protein
MSLGQRFFAVSTAPAPTAGAPKGIAPAFPHCGQSSHMNKLLLAFAENGAFLVGTS